MVASSTSRADISTGKYVYSGVDLSEIPVTFDKRMKGVPAITLRVFRSNKTAIAESVTPIGFTIVISDGGIDGERGTENPRETSYEIHYQAIYVY